MMTNSFCGTVGIEKEVSCFFVFLLLLLSVDKKKRNTQQHVQTGRCGSFYLDVRCEVAAWPKCTVTWPRSTPTLHA